MQTKVGFEVATGHPLVGTNLKAISFTMDKYVASGSVGGDGYCAVYNSSGTQKGSNSTTKGWNDLTHNTKEVVTFTFPSAIAIANGDRIVIEGGTYTANAQVDLYYQNSDVDANSGAVSFSSSGWSGVTTTTDIWYRSYATGGALVSSLTNKSGLKAHYTMDSTSLGAIDPNFEDNFPSGSESSGWTINNGTNTTFGSGKMTNKNVRTTTNQSVAKSLGVTTSSGAWLLRFKVKRTDSSGSQGRAFVEISNQDQGTGSGSSGLSSLRIQLHDTNGVVIEQVHGGSGSGSASLTSTLSADTDYWIQVIYTGTGATAQVFTDSSYSTPLSGTSTSTATSLTARTYQYFAIRNPDWSSDGHWKQYELSLIHI